MKKNANGNLWLHVTFQTLPTYLFNHCWLIFSVENVLTDLLPLAASARVTGVIAEDRTRRSSTYRTISPIFKFLQRNKVELPGYFTCLYRRYLPYRIYLS